MASGRRIAPAAARSSRPERNRAGTIACPAAGAAGQGPGRAGRYFRPADCLDTLRDPDLQAAAGGLLRRLTAHAGRKLDDDVA
ncbi:MAG TPA: hypothetical protein VFQ68_23585 [Streptosporangiaceae bacterium]|nr:hypothetical protein [Streptosporangiaceae bacterium]